MLASNGKMCFVDFGLSNRVDAAYVDSERVMLRAAAEGRADDQTG